MGEFGLFAGKAALLVLAVDKTGRVTNIERSIERLLFDSQQSANPWVCVIDADKKPVMFVSLITLRRAQWIPPSVRLHEKYRKDYPEEEVLLTMIDRNQPLVSMYVNDLIEQERGDKRSAAVKAGANLADLWYFSCNRRDDMVTKKDWERLLADLPYRSAGTKLDWFFKSDNTEENRQSLMEDMDKFDLDSFRGYTDLVAQFYQISVLFLVNRQDLKINWELVGREVPFLETAHHQLDGPPAALYDRAVIIKPAFVFSSCDSLLTPNGSKALVCMVPGEPVAPSELFVEDICALPNCCREDIVAILKGNHVRERDHASFVFCCAEDRLFAARLDERFLHTFACDSGILTERNHTDILFATPDSRLIAFSANSELQLAVIVDEQMKQSLLIGVMANGEIVFKPLINTVFTSASRLVRVNPSTYACILTMSTSVMHVTIGLHSNIQMVVSNI